MPVRSAFAFTLAFGFAFLPLPGVAQDFPSPGDLTSGSAIASAAESLAGQASDSLLVRDLFGKELKGSDGEVVGTVDDLAVIPGGRVVAAIVSTRDGAQIAVPFAAVKLTGSASALEVPIAASELSGLTALKSFADSLTQ